ncbi:DMT family transporter [Brevibacillus dissolubilis]|uniref:DMT family transporter n=1 Tax=Brevibacillus dissolubilis TaxID=1844116 RepID=UPI00159BD070|nr:DMT family transporter [Brevibacillus dissolubilis]
MPANKEKWIYLILTLVITIWGLNVVMVKYLSFFPPILIAAIRMSIAALVLIPIIVWKQGKTKITPKAWFYISGVALTSITLHQILLAWGVKETTAGNTSLILTLNPLTTALLAVPLLGEKLTLRKGVGVVLGFGGVLLVVATRNSGGLSSGSWGDILIFASMLMYVFGGLIVRKATSQDIPALTVTAYSHGIAAVVLWITAALSYPGEVFTSIDTRPFTWLVICTSGILATGLGTLGWNYGIGQLGASRTAVFMNGMPLASLIFAAVLLGEELQILHGIAFVLIVLGVYLGSQKGKQPNIAPAIPTVPAQKNIQS